LSHGGPTDAQPRPLLRASLVALLAWHGAASCAAPTQPRGAPVVTPLHTPPAPLIAAQLPALERALAQAVREQDAPGLVFGVVTADGLVWARAWGEQRRSPRHGQQAAPAPAPAPNTAPLTERSVLRFGSLTKLLTGAAILQLRDAGKLDLDDPVERFVPEARGIVYPSRDRPLVTIRHLVTHRSGFPRIGKVDYTRGDRDVTEAELLGELDGLRLESTPGRVTSYSNLAVALAGVVVARASGERYRDYVTAHLLVPIGMSTAAWSREEIPPAALALGHVREQGAWRDGPPHWRMGAMEAAGGLYGSLDDLGALARFALAAWVPGDDDGPLSKATRREWQTPASPPEPGESTHAINWIVGRDPELGAIVGHSGATFDYSATVVLAPERGLGIVAVMPSGDAEFLDRLAVRALRRLSLRGNWDQPLLPPPASEGPPREAVRQALARLFEKAPSDETLRELFSESFLAFKPPAELRALFEGIQRELGPCVVEGELLPGGSSREAVARVRCATQSLSVAVSVAPSPPHRIEGLTIKPAAR
jgi:CubicO group peptidase (beta-lactamase class C family)